jgi:hypothetical protein
MSRDVLGQHRQHLRGAPGGDHPLDVSRQHLAPFPDQPHDSGVAGEHRDIGERWRPHLT